MAWPGPAGIVAALALRAWIEVFSSAHTMIWPWRLNPWARSYKSKMGMAFSRKRGSVWCCQLQYCHGSTRSAASQRFTVEAEMLETIPSWITARASSLADQRDSGLPESRGNVQARAVTRARTAEGKKARPAWPRGFLIHWPRPAAAPPLADGPIGTAHCPGNGHVAPVWMFVGPQQD